MTGKLPQVGLIDNNDVAAWVDVAGMTREEIQALKVIARAVLRKTVNPPQELKDAVALIESLPV